jgi:hypothetical protein
VNRLLMLTGMTVGGYIGWAVGEYLGFELIGAFLISSLGSVAGVIAAWWVLTKYLD